MSKSKIQEKYEQHEQGQRKPQGKCRLCFREDGPFDVYAVRLDNEPRARMRITYPTHRAYEDGTVLAIPWTNDLLTEFLQPTLRTIRSVYVGQWCLDFRSHVAESVPTDRIYGARAEAEKRILQGPDTPGRRWLLRSQAQRGERQQIAAALSETMRTVPRTEPPHVATRQDLDALVDRLKAQPAPVASGPQAIDWSSENLDPKRHREPGEDD